MIIHCDKCNTKYRLDDSRVTGAGVKVKCTKCQNVFVVTPPEEAPVEEIIPTAPAFSEPAKQERSTAGEPETPNLKFDFNPTEDTPAEDKKPGETSFGFREPAASQDKTPASFNEIDFSFNMDNKESAPGPEDKGGFDMGAGVSDKEEPTAEEGAKKEDASFGDFDFNFGEDKPAEKKEEAAEDDWGLGSTGDEEPAAVTAPKEAEAKPQPKAEPVVTAAAAYAKTTAPAKNDAQEDLFNEDDLNESFSDLLKESLKGEAKPPAGTEDVLGEDEDFEAPAPEKKAAGKKPALLIALLVFIIGGGIIYFSGIVDTLAKRLTPSNQAATSLKTVEIEAINGYYVENKSFGKFFVVEAKLKNISDAPQSIKRVTGTVFGKDGEPIANKTVAPGRLVTQEELKNLSKEDLQKMFKDPSGGTIPAKGTVPVMVLFTELTDGVSEYGVDILR